MPLVKFEKKDKWKGFVLFASIYTFIVYMIFLGGINLFSYVVLGLPIEPAVGFLQIREAALVFFVPFAVAIALMIGKKQNIIRK